MKTTTFRVTGASPLLMNSAAAFTVADTGKSKTRQSIPTPEVEAEAGTYRLTTGACFLESTSALGPGQAC